MDNSPLYKRVITGFAWQGASKIVVQAVSWVSTVVVARLLEPSDYGVVAVGTVFIAMLNMIMEMGLSEGLIQKTEVTQEEQDGVFWLGVLIGTCLYLLLFFAAPAIAGFYHIPVLKSVLRIGGIVLIIGSIKAVPVAMIMRRLDFRFRSTREMSASLASTLTVISLAFAGAGVWSLVMGSMVQTAVLVIGYLPALGRVPRLTWHLHGIAPIVRYGMKIMFGNLAYVISSRADVFVVGKFLGEKLTGYYSMSFVLATMPLDKVGTIFNHVGFTSLSRSKDDEQQCRVLFRELHRQMLFIAYPLIIGTALVAEDAVKVFITEKWLPIVPIMQMLSVFSLMRVSAMLMPPLLNSRGKARWSLNYSVAGMILLPLAFFVGVQYGLMGVVVAWIATYPLLYAILLHYVRKDLGIRLSDLVSDSRPTFVAVAGMSTAVMAVQHYSAQYHAGPRLALAIASGAATYAGIFVVFYEEQVTRMRQAFRLLRSRA